MGCSAAFLGLLWLFLINTIGYAAVFPLDNINDNSLDESSASDNKQSRQNTLETKDWVRVSVPSDTVRVPPGGRVELECTVTGSPVPQAKWILGTHLNQITIGRSKLEKSKDYQGIGTVTIRKVIDCIKPHHRNVYTCIGQAGDQIMASAPIRILVEGEAVHCSQGETRITKWSPTIIQLMGSNVIIPCEVNDSTPYRKYWEDNFGNIIDTGNDLRYKSGPEGELVLDNLSWSDMGEYICVVENSISRDTITTFVYPALPDI